MQVQTSVVDLTTPTGPMRVAVYQPKADKPYPAVLLYSEIFQITAPITRMATILAGQGLLVLVPEVFHELNPPGTVLAYDDAGKDKGNQDKWTKPLGHYDSDNQALIAYLQTLAHWDGRVGAMGVCIGGHLALRAALQPQVRAALCLYPTDLHSDTLPAGNAGQTLARVGESTAQLVFVFGRQDPHVAEAGRRQIQQQLQQSGVSFDWHEVNAEHAFMRDEGERYDPALALWVYQRARELFLQM
ncbi:dienelactone hydrolase family protein [Rheinheimera sp. F8]|uniref:dienelactone hydrolase family protein n=1 Tax=Rheinheimera sp. F8 TaxID=1763998 RepID=UPI0007449F5F|nr:dienelactone hydrolase family protein [Rheinheimera sp. F8]ALZ74355.1 dienelactone hydrolase [Rheinheimera sp. F8]